jgi:hypothetical protein
MTDPLFGMIVMCSDGAMESVHSKQIDQLVARGLVFESGGRWRTELTLDELSAYVSEEMPVCDFCSRDDPAWTFPCETFEEPNVPWLPFRHMSVGQWGACETCAKLIRTRRWNRLASRCVQSIMNRHSDWGEGERRLMVVYMRKLHREFEKHRTGPPVREESC